MALERIAALIWRFIGLGLILYTLPGAIMLSTGVVSSMGGTTSYPLMGHVATVVMVASAQIVIGATVIRFSDRLGMAIARGL